MSTTFYRKDLDTPEYERPGANIALTSHAGPGTLKDRSCVQITVVASCLPDGSRGHRASWVSLTRSQAKELVNELYRFIDNQPLSEV